MSFEQPSFPQESRSESLSEDLSRKIAAMNELQAKAAAMDIDEIDLRPDAIDAQAHLMTDVFTAAEEHPEAFLEIAAEIKDPETRRDLIGKAVIGIGARGDAMAFEAAIEAYKGNVRSHERDEETIGNDVEKFRMEAIEKRMEALIDAGDVLEAAKVYMEEYRWPNSVVKNRIAGPISKFVRDGADLQERIERYNRLPDRFPEPSEGDLAKSLYRNALEGVPKEMPWEEQKAELKRLFADAPEILAYAAHDYYASGWDKDDHLEIFKAVRDKGDRESALSQFLEYEFSDEGFQELKPDLFKAYAEFKTDAILDRIEKFSAQFLALPDGVRLAMIEEWIREKPEMLVYRLGKTLRLDEGQQKAVFARIAEEAPARFSDPDFRKKLGWSEEDVVRRAREAGASAKFLRGAAGYSDEAVTALANEVAADPPRDFPLDFATLIKRGVEFDPERVQQGLQKLLGQGRISDLMQLEGSTKSRLDVARLPEDVLASIKLTGIEPLLESYPELAERLPMAGMIDKLEKIQGRAARAEHDAWKQELDPLLAAAYQEAILSPEKPEDAELFIEFVKEFGAVNTPKLFETYIGLKRAKALEEIPEVVRSMLEEALGKKRVEKMKTPAFLLNEIRKFDRGMVSALLKDEIPAGMTSALGLELFDQKKGGSSWEQDDDPKELIAKWETFARVAPERAKVPEGYKETRMAVPLMRRGASKMQPSAELEKPEVKEAFAYYARCFRESRPDTEWIEKSVEGLRQTLGQEADGDRWSAFFVEAKKWTSLQALGEPQMVRMMETLPADAGAEVDDILLRLSAHHLTKATPDRFLAIIDAFRYERKELGAEEVKELRSLLVDFVSEHYLHPSQETHRVGHAPFSEGLRTRLENLWKLDGDREANPVVRAHKDIEAEKKKRSKTSEKTKEIALVPAHGLLRVYGGDIADACYTSRHDELAKGKYPDLHAMVFVTGRGTANERFAGSTLFVETETTREAGGKRVLMVRANNPRENLIQDVDADALVRQTLDAAIAIAKERGLDMVVVPLDAASQSSSNRPAVADYYQENFADEERVPLVRKSETNFNSYANWDPDSGHGVVKVWSREDEEPG